MSRNPFDALSVPRWFTRASQALGRPDRAKPEPFDIQCACGQRVRGVRRTSPQHAGCKLCGAHLFVLPLDAYPPLKQRRTPKPGASDGAAAAPADAAQGPRVRELLKRQAGRIRSGTAVAKTRAKAALIRVARRQRAFFTPFRLVMLSVAAIVGLTAYWAIHNSRIRSAQETFVAAEQAGRAAMSQSEYALAAQQFERACRALDLLGRDDVQARGVRQLLRESTAVTQLASAPLSEIISEYNEASQKNDTILLQAHGNLYRGSWLVLDTTIERLSNADGTSRSIVDLPVLVDGRPLAVGGDFAAFGVLPPTAEPRRVVFAAQFDSCRLDGPAQDRWLVALRPETSFLWSSSDTLRWLGLAADDSELEPETARVLAEQSRLLGIQQ